jgi:hypothetical protein
VADNELRGRESRAKPALLPQQPTANSQQTTTANIQQPTASTHPTDAQQADNQPTAKVQLSTHRKNWHLGYFDDHTKAVAAYDRHKSMTKTELEQALDKRR